MKYSYQEHNKSSLIIFILMNKTKQQDNVLKTAQVIHIIFKMKKNSVWDNHHVKLKICLNKYLTNKKTYVYYKINVQQCII